MSWWLALVRAADARAVDREARRLESMAASIESLGEQLKTVRRAVEGLATELRAVERETERLIALREEDGNAPARLDRLERALDSDRVTSHVGEAVAQGALAEDPVPHLVISNLLPDDVFRALVEAFPAPVFFDDAGGRRELSLPLMLGPVHAMAAWTYVAKAVRKTLGSAILARFEERPDWLLMPGSRLDTRSSAALSASRGRVALRRPGDAIPAERGRAAQVLTTVVPLVASDERVDLLLRRLDDASAPGSAGPAPARTLSLPRNSALAFHSVRGAIELAAPPPGTSAVYTYEFAIGPLSRER